MRWMPPQEAQWPVHSHKYPRRWARTGQRVHSEGPDGKPAL